MSTPNSNTSSATDSPVPVAPRRTMSKCNIDTDQLRRKYSMTTTTSYSSMADLQQQVKIDATVLAELNAKIARENALLEESQKFREKIMKDDVKIALEVQKMIEQINRNDEAKTKKKTFKEWKKAWNDQRKNKFMRRSQPLITKQKTEGLGIVDKVLILRNNIAYRIGL